MLKKRSKIALIIRLLPNRSGGAERLYCELANMLVEHGQDVTCIYYDDAKGDPFFSIRDQVKLENLSKKTKANKSSYRISPQLKKIYSFLMRTFLLRMFNKHIWNSLNKDFIDNLKDYFLNNKIDVAISFMPTANTVTLLAAKGTSTKVIVTNHNVPEQDYNSPLRWDPNPYDRKLRLEALNYADAIHVLFPGFGRWFPDKLQSKITAIPNYVSDDFTSGHLYNVQREKIILAVGRLAEVKNYTALLEAWYIIHDKFPEWKVVLYGNGPQRKLLAAEIQKLGLSGSFLLRGHKANLAEDYASASLFCHPALFEGFGLSVAEALSFRLPVIAFHDCAGVNEYVKDGFNGVLVPRSGGSEALSREIEKLIRDEHRRVMIGNNGPMSISEYTRSKYFHRWCELIDRVVR